MKRYLLLLGFLLSLVNRESAFAQASCDKNKECVGNALTITRTQGKLAQYVDVDVNDVSRKLTTAMTFEAWLKPEQQGGKKV